MKRPPYHKAPFDPDQSTYRQILLFPNGKTLTGYSKRKFYAEVQNKTNLLTNWICRNHRDGYLDERNDRRDTVDSIDYYWKNKKGIWVHSFTMYQNYPVWHDSSQRHYLDSFFESFYDLKRKGEEVYDHLYVVDSAHRSFDPLDLSKHSYKSINFLRSHCERIITKNIRELGEVKNFYIQYVEKYFKGYGSDDEKFFNSFLN